MTLTGNIDLNVFKSKNANWIGIPNIGKQIIS